jgi:hypothetical protein
MAMQKEGGNEALAEVTGRAEEKDAHFGAEAVICGRMFVRCKLCDGVQGSRTMISRHNIIEQAMRIN